MIAIAGIAGSLRQGSYNRALLRAAAELMPEGAVMNVLSIDAVPLYHGDVEAQGIPTPIATLKQALAGAAGLVLVTPEYNNGIPGVLKNAIDWMSRPAADIPRVFGGKSVALLGATPGGGGTILAQVAWLPVLRVLRMKLWTAQGPFYVSGAAKVFDASGLIDAELRERLRKYMAAFVEHVRAQAG
ncbi:MAG TPA: NADPH-dependent FMN reductase [Gammaproteobacteria bacterium]|jgi:NAD(P)H-dependent FMN reductase